MPRGYLRLLLLQHLFRKLLQSQTGFSAPIILLRFLFLLRLLLLRLLLPLYLLHLLSHSLLSLLPPHFRLQVWHMTYTLELLVSNPKWIPFRLRSIPLLFPSLLPTVLVLLPLLHVLVLHTAVFPHPLAEETLLCAIIIAHLGIALSSATSLVLTRETLRPVSNCCS